MGVVSNRNVQISYSGDAVAEFIQSALENPLAFGDNYLTSLVAGDTVIGVPSVAGLVVTGLTIIPPAGNIVQLKLKGIVGDTGIALHLTDPSSIALAPSVTSFVLNCGIGGVVGLRLIWT